MVQLQTTLNSPIQANEIRPFKMAKTMYQQCMNTAQIEGNGVEYIREKLNLTTKWPVLSKEDEFDESTWNATEFNRFSVDFFIDTDVKNTSRRVLYVRFNFSFTSHLLLQLNLLLKTDKCCKPGIEPRQFA